MQYNDTWVGRNINLTYGRTIYSKWRIYGGLKYHINGNLYRGDIRPLNYITPDEHAIFYNFHASTVKEHLGLKAGIERKISLSTNADLFLFYDFQYMPSFELEGGGGGIDSAGNAVLITPFPFYVGKAKHFQEHTIGCGISVRATERIGIKIQGGLGVSRHTGFIDNSIRNGWAIVPQLALGHILGLGLDYHLKPGKTSKPQSRKRYR